MDEIETKLHTLRNELRKYEYHYYVLDDPLVSDATYDGKIEALRALETNYPELITEDSPTQRVGGLAAKQFSNITHRQPLLSLDNAFSMQDLEDFDQRTKKVCAFPRYTTELKIDGLSIILAYDHGKLVYAATRGDGTQGEDVTANIRMIRSIPLHLTEDIAWVEIRGEVYMPKSSFARLNTENEEKGLKPFANPRNAAAGSLRQLDPNITKQRDLSTFFYDIVYSEGLTFSSQQEMLEVIRRLGLPVNPENKRCDSIKEAFAFCECYTEKRHDLAYDIDGIVVKLDQLAERGTLGTTSKSPRWAVAYKFPAEIKESRLLEVELNVGRTGIIAPTAVLESISLAGTVVQRATLHNFDLIQEKDIRLGDVVWVHKAGDIIPEVIGPVIEKRTGEEMLIWPPSICPACENPVIRLEGEVAYRCAAANCPSRFREKIIFFASRVAMDIEGLGPAMVQTLIENQLVKSVADLYRLSIPQLIQLERMGEKSAQNLVDAIQRSKANPLSRLLTALGIPHVGSRTAKLLCAQFSSMSELLQLQEPDLISIDEIGPKIAESIVSFFQQADNHQLIDQLVELGLTMDEPHGNQVQTLTEWTGKNLVLTGTLSRPRKEFEIIIEQYGGKISNNVSKKTDYVIVGKDAGSKYDKALALDIPILKEEEFIALLHSNRQDI